MGNITASCKAAKINRTTFYNWKAEDPAFFSAIQEIEESSIDFAESKLKQQISEGNTTATIFYLKTKGKDRGYVERVENTQRVIVDTPSRENIIATIKEEMKDETAAE